MIPAAPALVQVSSEIFRFPTTIPLHLPGGIFFDPLIPYLVPVLFVGAFEFSRGTGERFLHWAGTRRVGRFVDSAFLRENKIRPAFGFLLLSVIHIYWDWSEEFSFSIFL